MNAFIGDFNQLRCDNITDRLARLMNAQCNAISGESTIRARADQERCPFSSVVQNPNCLNDIIFCWDDLSEMIAGRYGD